MITPVNNHVLIEIIDKYGGVVRDRKDETRSKGKVLAYSYDQDHITASTGYQMSLSLEKRKQHLDALKGQTVLFQQYADEGQTFDQDGKKYSLVYWWRIMGVYPEGEGLGE
jgi:co-chaperonin GroES (HSP10)